MNLSSFIKVYFSTIVQGYGVNYNTIGKVMILSNIIFGIIMRISSMILYFAPSLGLLNLLHHYQAEMIGFQVLDPFIQSVDNIVSLSNKSISLSNVQRGYFESANYYAAIYIPPPIELYTKFSLQSYFFIFLGILTLQCLSIVIIDKLFVKTIPPNTTWWQRIIHAIQKSNIPCPFVYWHEGKGDQKEHIQRLKDTEFEVLLTIFVNLLFNMALLFPLVILYFGILERHDYLSNTVGHLEMEVTSFQYAQLCSYVFFPTWICLSILQFLSFKM